MCVCGVCVCGVCVCVCVCGVVCVTAMLLEALAGVRETPKACV